VGVLLDPPSIVRSTCDRKTLARINPPYRRDVQPDVVRDRHPETTQTDEVIAGEQRRNGPELAYR
jgi:hypothetical protein